MLENVQPQQTHSPMIILYGKDVPSHAIVSTEQSLLTEAEEAWKMSPVSLDIHPKLSVKKTDLLLKIRYCKIIESVCS